MAILWRISDFEDLHGIGGLKASGRWHSQGHLIVYLAEHPALALLEVMAGLDIDLEDLPDRFKLLKVEVDDAELSQCHVPTLHNDWVKNERGTQSEGNNWLKANQTLLAKVPSAILPESTNYLFNASHPNAKHAKIIDVIHFPFDERLVS
ncbi:RES family NAD+ phosphorylase [Vibrio sp. 16]